VRAGAAAMVAGGGGRATGGGEGVGREPCGRAAAGERGGVLRVARLHGQARSAGRVAQCGGGFGGARADRVRDERGAPRRVHEAAAQSVLRVRPHRRVAALGQFARHHRALVVPKVCAPCRLTIQLLRSR
jgi:hypothetical protein